MRKRTGGENDVVRRVTSRTVDRPRVEVEITDKRACRPVERAEEETLKARWKTVKGQ